MRTTRAIRNTMAVVAIGATLLFANTSNAQYFLNDSANYSQAVIEADGADSVLFLRETQFDLPKVSDTIALTYHEPMPDSIMPRSAIVLGEITVQAGVAEDVSAKIEKYARKYGADWIVSFSEPRVVISKKGERIYRSSATLLHVLDATFINQSQITNLYFEDTKIANFAALEDWYGTYGKHMGAKVDAADSTHDANTNREK
jgi:hypothetical protein